MSEFNLQQSLDSICELYRIAHRGAISTPILTYFNTHPYKWNLTIGGTQEAGNSLEGVCNVTKEKLRKQAEELDANNILGVYGPPWYDTADLL